MQPLYKLYRSVLDDADRLMALTILSLHALLVWGDTSAFFNALLLCHYGFFLLWQPILRHNKALNWQQVLLIVVFATGAAVLFKNLWFIAFWVAGLFSLIGGRALSSSAKHGRLPKILAASYLLTILLIWVVPKLIDANGDLAAAKFVLNYLLPILPLAILFLPASNKPAAQARNIDFFYTLLIFLLTVILILGSFAIGVIWQIHYLKLLIFVVFGLAATLVTVSWLWNPSKTFSGLELLMSRYLLSVGLPFEQWIRNIANHAEKQSSSDDFLLAAMHELAALNWVSGLTWQHDGQKQEFGKASEHVSTYSFQQLQLTMYSRWQFTPAMYLHVQLLTQIIEEFYEAKCREETISKNMYMQTLYETGSRLTHDIKNILQSLGTLSSAVEQNQDAANDAKLIELIKTQLPRLSRRLANTLTKLELPSVERKNQEKVSLWWANFKQISAHYQIEFEAPANLPKTDIDTDVLDSVVDNLLQNALTKAKREQGIKINVSLMPSSYFCIEVTDTGSAIPPEIANKLFKSNISSSNGLGVGLYHAAQQARLAGYELSLTDNEDGEVRFRLEMIAR
ncbi:MAG TPA: HAMP domain-containing sensor histidine kinase [Methylotenera sp.]